MKKIYLLTWMFFLFVMNSLAQVAVTNPANTTPNLAATYGSLAAAVTALSGITAISGPVVITLNAGNPETAPAGGYVIQFTAATTAVNNITIEGSNNTITASAALVVNRLYDGIFKLIGVDYITLQHFNMQENAANTVNTPEGSNNMTEWGVALLHASTTNGAQNNTIQNNIITLNKTYANTWGIYSSSRHSATNPVSANDAANNTTAPNSGNKIYGNNISNVNFGISFIGAAISANMDVNTDIGGNSVVTGNTISNWGGMNALSFYNGNSATSYCIYVNHQINENVSYNSITSAVVSGTSVSFHGIRKEYGLAQPVGTFTSNITYNTITMSSNFTVGVFGAIISQGMTALSTATINISNNTVLNCALSLSAFGGISNLSAPGILNMNNNSILGTTSAATAAGYTGLINTGAVVTTININNNQLGNTTTPAATFSAATTGLISGINSSNAASTATVNINNNSFDGFSFVSSGTINLILGATANPLAVNINGNQFGTVSGSLINFSGAQASAFNVINNGGGNAGMAVSIQNNDIRGIVHAVGASCSEQLIASLAAVSTNMISNNTFTNLNINTSGNITFIKRSGAMASGASSTISNNSIVGTFTAPGLNDIYMYDCLSASVTGSTLTISGNDFSNITVTGTGGVFGINDSEGSSASAPAKTITGNTFNNTNLGSGQFVGILVNYGPAVDITSNSITNVSGSWNMYGIFLVTGFVSTSCSVASNTISALSSTGGNVFGIYGSNGNSTTSNINGNNISGLSSAGISSALAGIYFTSGQTINIYDNVINTLSGSGTTSPICNGIWITGGTGINIYRNNIYNLLESGSIFITQPAVSGIAFSNIGGIATVYNNFISDLKATNANMGDAVRGININGNAASTTYNLYYNSVYLNAVSTGANFGTSGIYHLANTTATTGAMNMIDNIIVNTSTANGGGITAAYRRSNSTGLDNYASTSDYNNFYAGTPGPYNVIYYDGTNSDQTLAAYQTRVNTRDANSISLMPNFVSTTDLHLTAVNCRIDGRGTPVAGITDDIDLAARNATTPDMGADEFTATTSTALAGSAGGAVCEDRTIAVTGTTYRSNACDLIARVLPSGADPVAGKVNVCVTLDAVQQYFNGEPYVQRHFDMEPTSSNQTSTSATITLYFTNAEFALYNSTNPAWPQLPTSMLGNADPNRANVKVTQFHGAATTSPSSPGNYPGTFSLITPGAANVFWNGTFWEVTFNVAGFSGFYVHTNNFNAPLPIIVNYLTGHKQGSNHLLNWKVTCNSTPRVTITIERSADLRNFTGINTITADAARCQQPFDYTDANPLKGMNYYRLKIVDADGKVTYSTTVALLNALKGFDIVSIAPNPVVGNNFKLNVASAQAGKMDISIFDMQGRLVNRHSLTLIAGFNSMPVNVANLAPGTYTIQSAIADDKLKVLRFVKQ